MRVFRDRKRGKERERGGRTLFIEHSGIISLKRTAIIQEDIGGGRDKERQRERENPGISGRIKNEYQLSGGINAACINAHSCINHDDAER